MISLFLPYSFLLIIFIQMNSYIKSLGHFVPENRVSNQDLSQLMDTSDEWIVERTGIEERRFINKGTETSASLGLRAAQNALKNAEMSPQDIDFIIFATLSPDLYFPGCGVLLQDALGCNTIGALDVRNQCSGFIYALDTADSFIKSGKYKNILVVGSEVHSFGLDMTTRGRNVSVIFGDGAGACIVSATEDPNKGILASNLHSEGAYAEELSLRFPGTKYGWVDKMLDSDYQPNFEEIYPFMNGNFVFKNAVVRFSETILESFIKANRSIEELNLLIPHQANLRIAQFIQKQLKLSDDQVFNNIQHYGNTTAASIPIALSEAVEQNKLNEGDLLCLAAFGSGFTWGSVLIKW